MSEGSEASEKDVGRLLTADLNLNRSSPLVSPLSRCFQHRPTGPSASSQDPSLSPSRCLGSTRVAS